MLQKNIKSLFNCNLDIIINGIELNSKNVKNGNLFICRVGINSNGYEYIEDAVKNGAVVIVCSKKPKIKIPYILVDDVNENIAYIFEWFYGNLNNYFKNVIGVTGTSGKTSIINIINQILENEYKSFFVGTNGISYMNKEEKDILNTTYPIEQYYKIMYDAYKQNFEIAILELSSYGLKYNRIGNTLLNFAIVTNLSEAHLNEHKDFNDYIESKLKIIDHIKKDGYLIINYDDKYKDRFIEKFNGNILTFGSNENADISFYNINLSLTETSFVIKYKNKEYDVKTKLIGITNIYNVCVSILVANLVGVDIEKCIKYLSNYFVKGRMENYKNIIIDFAVTPIALKENISFINEHKKGRLISVIGKIEDREINEYKKYGNISTKYSDYVIFTTDKNKTNESLAVKYMTENLEDNNYEIMLDRKEAIKKGIELLQKNDTLYIVGCEYFFRTSFDKDVNPYEIIDRDTFNYVQTLLPKNVKRPEKKRFYLLDGLLYCGDCKHRITVRYQNKTGRSYTTCDYYRTYSKYHVCTTHTNNYETLERVILDTIRDVCKNYLDKNKIKDSIGNIEFEDNALKIKKQIESLEITNNKLTENLDKNYMNMLKGIIDEEQYIRVSENLKKEIENNKRGIDNLKNENSESNKIDNKMIEKYINEFLSLENPTRELIVNLVEKIYIYQDKTIDIIFTFKNVT